MATLYVVSTPIGNLADLTPRAAETLRSVARILAEDTRHSRVVVDRAGARAPMVSLHEHNEAERVSQVLGWLAEGEDLALVSDAGTPLVSDPGTRLVREVAAAGHPVVPVPGASAVLAALVASGLSTERFAFLGFADRGGPGRKALLDRVARSPETVVLFESPVRTARLLDELAGHCEPERGAAVARELTKLFEEVRRGTLAELARYYRSHPPKGEVTVVVGPADPHRLEAEAGARREVEGRELARELLADGARPSSVAKELTRRLDLARNDAYRIVHDLEGDRSDE